jgi:hypothetical protein
LRTAAVLAVEVEQGTWLIRERRRLGSKAADLATVNLFENAVLDLGSEKTETLPDMR